MIPLDLKFPLTCLPFHAIRLCELSSQSRPSLPSAALLQKHNSRILNHLRTLQKRVFPATLFPSMPCALFCKTGGYGGVLPPNTSSLTRRWRHRAPRPHRQPRHARHSHFPSIPNLLNRLRTVSVTRGCPPCPPNSPAPPRPAERGLSSPLRSVYTEKSSIFSPTSTFNLQLSTLNPLLYLPITHHSLLTLFSGILPAATEGAS